MKRRTKLLERSDNQRKFFAGMLAGGVYFELTRKLQIDAVISFIVPAVIFSIRQLQYHQVKKDGAIQINDNLHEVL